MILNTIWEQQYNPMGNIWLSAAVAALPIVIFLISLVVFKLKGYTAGGLSILSAAIVAAVCYKMPVDKIAGAAEQGIVSGLWPVASIVLAAIFLYKLTVKMGFFDVMKQSSSISPDKRIQVLLIAFSFNAFLEGAAGFGAPVAITAAILVGLGFKPLQSAAICLVANIAGGAYGAMGIPVTVPATLTDLDALTLGKNTSLILCLVTVIIAFLIVFMVDGFKGIKETFPAIIVSGGGFAVTQFIFLNFVGPELVNVSSAIVSLLALIVFLRFWQPKQSLTAETKEISKDDKGTLSGKEVVRAWTPFILLTLFVTLLNTGFFKQLIQAANPKTGQTAGALNSLIFNFPYYIDGAVARVAPIVKQPTPIKAVFSFAPFTSTTTAILLAAILTIIIFRVNSRIVISTIRETAVELWGPILTICSVLAFAYISTYSGMSSTLGLAFANTGKVFPLFSPILGWIGVFLTGSVVNSGSLFAGLQSVTASQIGIDPSLLVAANIMGGAIAKMISPQSIAVAAAAVGLVNRDSEIFAKTIKWSVILLVLAGVLNLLITLR